MMSAPSSVNEIRLSQYLDALDPLGAALEQGHRREGAPGRPPRYRRLLVGKARDPGGRVFRSFLPIIRLTANNLLSGPKRTGIRRSSEHVLGRAAKHEVSHSGMAEPAHDKKLRTALDRVLLDGYADRAILGVDGVTLGNQGAVPEASGQVLRIVLLQPFFVSDS